MKKEKLSKSLLAILVAFLFLFIFRSWFLPKLIFGGDFSFPQGFSFLPFAWDVNKGNGLGGFAVQTLWIDLYAQILPNFLLRLGIPGILVQKSVFFLPFLFFSYFSGIFLFRTVLPQRKEWSFLAPVIFGLNTYILMIAAGGQMGIALAYSMAPLVLGLFIKCLNEKILALSLVTTGLALALQIMFDLRIAFLTMGAVFLYLLAKNERQRVYFLAKNERQRVYFLFNFKILRLFIPIIISLLLHSYWLLPLILTKHFSLPGSLNDPGWLNFLSFADFTHSFSLLHPNWPENIFGKTYFMRPEFIVIPLLAFSSLLFLSISKFRSQNSKPILFFALLGLIGAFLAKGVNPPFGGVYLWLFEHFPGMNMFRDSTKFYLLVALSYSILIPYSVGHMYEWIKSRGIQKYLPSLFLLLIVLYLLLLIKPAFMGELGGTFKQREVPKEYVLLKDFLASQPEFFRTLWVPRRQRFGFYDNNHPAIDGQDFLKVTSASAREILSDASVKYVIIPYDSESEIFLEDRKYSWQKRKEIEDEIDKIPWLRKINLSDKIAVYETLEQREHFWIEQPQGLTLGVNYQMINPTKYSVRVKKADQPFTLVFSEAYDNFWQIKMGDKKINSKPYKEIFNSFEISETGDFEITVEFTIQKYLFWGSIISVLTLFIILPALMMSKRI